MLKLHNDNKLNSNENSSSSFIPEKNFVQRQRQRKSKTIRNEIPDILTKSNSSLKQPQKLLLGRSTKKRMTQLEKNIDLPDTLLGLNEYKEMKFAKNNHTIKKLRKSCYNPDLPDILEPVQEIITSNIPKPCIAKEESKNQELEEIKKKKKLDEIKKLEEKKKESIEKGQNKKKNLVYRRII